MFSEAYYGFCPNDVALALKVFSVSSLFLICSYYFPMYNHSKESEALHFKMHKAKKLTLELLSIVIMSKKHFVKAMD